MGVPLLDSSTPPLYPRFRSLAYCTVLPLNRLLVSILFLLAIFLGRLDVVELIFVTFENRSRSLARLKLQFVKKHTIFIDPSHFFFFDRNIPNRVTYRRKRIGQVLPYKIVCFCMKALLRQHPVSLYEASVP